MKKAAATLAATEAVLTARLNEVKELLNADVVDSVLVNRRFRPLIEDFSQYDRLRRDFMVITETSEIADEWTRCRQLYQEVEDSVAALSPSEPGSSGSSGTPFATSTFIERQLRSKLPIAQFPKFNGDCNQWVSFKNAFHSMVYAREDLDVISKFIYLRDALQGEALRKIEIFEFSKANFQSAWESLLQAYDRKRILVYKHLRALTNLQPVKVADSKALVALIDEVKQHLSMLRAYGVRPGDDIIICLVEDKLPTAVRDKWEEALNLDELPTLQRLYDFMERMVARYTNAEINNPKETRKRVADTEQSSTKKKASNFRVLATSVEPCTHCGEAHPIFHCRTFKDLSVPARIQVVKDKGLCSNCLRKHEGKCPAGHCKLCSVRHHTLLHQGSSKDAGGETSKA